MESARRGPGVVGDAGRGHGRQDPLGAAEGGLAVGAATFPHEEAAHQTHREAADGQADPAGGEVVLYEAGLAGGAGLSHDDDGRGHHDWGRGLLGSWRGLVPHWGRVTLSVYVGHGWWWWWGDSGRQLQKNLAGDGTEHCLVLASLLVDGD